MQYIVEESFVDDSDVASLPLGYSAVQSQPESFCENRLLNDVGALRFQEWSAKGMDMSSSLVKGTWIEIDDYHSYLWGIYHRGKLVASARLSIHHCIDTLPESSLYLNFVDTITCPIASFNRLVVHPSHRGLKLSTFLIEERVQLAYQLGARSIVFDCPESRVNAMRKHGFHPLGRPQQGAKCRSIRWIVMYRKLTR